VLSSRDVAEQIVKGFPLAKFKSFPSKIQAQKWFNDTAKELGLSPLSETPSSSVNAVVPVLAPVPVPAPTALPFPSTWRSSAETESALRTRLNISPTAQLIYTDGACPSNGRLGGRAGVGIFFSQNDPRNLSARLPGTHQTNQRAELFAVLKTLEILHHQSCPPGEYVVITDSKYVVQAVTQWAVQWERGGWRTSTGSEVVSKDLFKRARDMLRTLDEKGVKVEFKHVRGHSGVEGNERADELAVQGAWMDVVATDDWEKMYDDEDLDALLVAEMANHDPRPVNM
jgi:ribonuclease HI